MLSLTFTPYERAHYEALLTLLFQSNRSHVHLDWQTVSQWLEATPHTTLLAWQKGTLVGALGVGAPLDGSAWVRLLVVANDQPIADVLAALWAELLARLKAQPMTQLSVLVISRWLSPYLGALGLRYMEDVVSLSRVGGTLPDSPPTRCTLENAYLDALPDLVTIDHAAFPPMWRMPREELRQAQRQSASALLTRLDGRAVGYLLATRSDKTAHLARIAVLPSVQGQGVAAYMLRHLLAGLPRRGVQAISVNTQQSNLRSQKLYQRFGFRRSGFDLPVWTLYM